VRQLGLVSLERLGESLDHAVDMGVGVNRPESYNADSKASGRELDGARAPFDSSQRLSNLGLLAVCVVLTQNGLVSLTISSFCSGLQCLRR
jgi:hypothetical protein